MFSSFAILGLAPTFALAIPFDHLSPFKRDLNPSASFQWEPCFDNPNIECSTYSAPLDYADPNVGNVSLAVARYKATNTPRLGTLWVNPGGPGNSGVYVIASGEGQLASYITGGYFDIASWDPRGVNNSGPSVKCFSSVAEETAFWNQSAITAVGIEEHGNFTDPADLENFYGQVNEVDSLLDQFGETCNNASGAALQYIGSVAAVRDMVAMTDVLDGEGAPINYLGFSYGTIIGEYLVNMFPNRTGRIVLDGVVNAELLSNGPSYQIWGNAISDAEKELVGFTNACVTAGPNCTISNSQNSTAIYEWIRTLIDDAYYAYKNGSSTTSSSAVRRMIFQAMYTPSTWSDLAQYLSYQDMLLHGVGTNPNTAMYTRYVMADDINVVSERLRAGVQTNVGRGFSNGAAVRQRKRRGLIRARDTSTNAPPSHVEQAIYCSDTTDPTYTTKDVFDGIVNVTQQVSNVFGPQWGEDMMFCHRWPARAVERFTGPFNHTLRNTILVIGNEADPITPFKNAAEAAAMLGSSATLMEQSGFGHTSQAMVSYCTMKNVATYFITGQLPQNGTQCAVDQQPFDDSQNYTSSSDGLPNFSNMTAVPLSVVTKGNTSGASSSLAGGPWTTTTLGFAITLLTFVL